MTKIRNKIAYPDKEVPVIEDYLVGSDSETSDKDTVSFPLSGIVSLITSYTVNGENGMISLTVERDGNTFTVLAGATGNIGGIQYTSTEDYVVTIDEEEAGFKRNDTLVFNTAATFEHQVGTADEDVVMLPTTPLGKVLAVTFSIIEDAIDVFVPDFDQDNIRILIDTKIIQDGIVTLDEILESLNAHTPYAVGEKNLVIYSVLHFTGVEYKVYKFLLMNRGFGVYGVGYTQLDQTNLQLVYAGSPSLTDIENLADTVIIDLGNIGAVEVMDYINAAAGVGYVIQDQEDGYTIINAIVNGIAVSYLFIGAGGTYGADHLQSVEEDYQFLSNVMQDSSEVEKITENGKTGWRLKGSNPALYDNIGLNAVDLSIGILNGTNNYGASGNFSFARNYKTRATGIASDAGGNSSVASGASSRAGGNSTTASGIAANSQGSGTLASGDWSHAGGSSTVASGVAASADGIGNTAPTYAESVVGVHGLHQSGNATAHSVDDPAFRVGIGTSVADKKNGLVVMKSGAVSAPQQTNALIVSTGAKSLITKEYFDANPSGDGIPLTGTEVGSPLTGTIESTTPFPIVNGNLVVFGVDELLNLDECENGAKTEYRRDISSNEINNRVIRNASEASIKVLLNTDGSGSIFIGGPTSLGFKGITGGQDYTPNITDLDYTQKKYVDDVTFNKQAKIVPDAAYSLLNTDANKILHFTNASAVTVTIPTGLTNTRFEGKQLGLGQVSFVADGTTLQTDVDEILSTKGQYSSFAIDLIGTEEYMVYGKLALV